MEEVDLIGLIINYLGDRGRIKYAGPLKHNQSTSSDIWLGVEWFNDKRGKH